MKHNYLVNKCDIDNTQQNSCINIKHFQGELLPHLLHDGPLRRLQGVRDRQGARPVRPQQLHGGQVHHSEHAKQDQLNYKRNVKLDAYVIKAIMLVSFLDMNLT